MKKPVTTIRIEPVADFFRLGQSVTVWVSTKAKPGTLKRTELFLNNTLITTSDQSEFSAVIPALETTGVMTLKAVSENIKGADATRIANFTVLSDLIPVAYRYTLVREYPHSDRHFTQGLEFHDGFLYEGTGEQGKSALYKIVLSSGKTVKEKPLGPQYFGEGITVLNNKIYQLTYKNRIGFVYNLEDFSVADSFRFISNEGWGLTNDGINLIMSDGTGTLTWISPSDYSVLKKIQVTDHEKVYRYLNELEFDNGAIWANVWTTDRIIRIDPDKGIVTGYVDVKGILGVMDAAKSEGIDVLNGIARLPQTGHLLITGKRWPKLFEIQVDH